LKGKYEKNHPVCFGHRLFIRRRAGAKRFFVCRDRIEIDIPVYFQAPLSPQKDEGVIPDVPVKRAASDIGNDFDREIEVIRKNF
jgi:hypothetical protein